MGFNEKVKTQSNSYAVIFIAPGFDEEFVVQFYCKQKRKGMKVLLVGTRGGDIFGRNGLTLPIHATVSEFTQQSAINPTLVCIPGNARCATAVLSDPRVLKFLQKPKRAICAAESARRILGEVGIHFE